MIDIFLFTKFCCFLLVDFAFSILIATLFLKLCSKLYHQNLILKITAIVLSFSLYLAIKHFVIKPFLVQYLGQNLEIFFNSVSCFLWIILFFMQVISLKNKH